KLVTGVQTCALPICGCARIWIHGSSRGTGRHASGAGGRAARSREDEIMTRKEFLKLTSMAAAAPVSGASGVRDSGGVRLQPDSAQPRHAFPTGVTAAVVEFIQSSSFDRMPQKATAEAKRCLSDGFGVVLAGSTVRGSEIVREHVTTRACGSREESESAPAANQADVRRSAVAGGDGAPRAVK